VTQDERTQITLGEEAWRGAVKQPKLAILLGKDFSATLSARLAALHGSFLTRSLTNAGLGERALDFTLESPSDFHSDWISAILTTETARSPESAAYLWQKLPEGEMKRNAWKTINETWSSRDAPGLCSYAIATPSSAPERAETLKIATQAWCKTDPTSYTEWLNSVESQDDFNQGLALLVTNTDSLFRSPDDALNWTELITDHQLRLSCAAQVIKEWATDQPQLALSWIEKTQWLDDEQRDQLSRSLRPSFLPAD
jgi:hypothetical protein